MFIPAVAMLPKTAVHCAATTVAPNAHSTISDCVDENATKLVTKKPPDSDPEDGEYDTISGRRMQLREPLLKKFAPSMDTIIDVSVKKKRNEVSIRNSD